MPEPPRNAFQYAIIRVLPRVERGESPQRRGRPAVPAGALPRGADRARREAARGASPRTSTRPRSGRTSTPSSGSPPAIPTAGPIARLGQAERFHWLVSPSSTMIQPSEVHAGLCDDPAAELDHLVATLVD